MEIAKMSAAQLTKAMEKARTESSKITQMMIDAGRGYEYPNEMMKKSDPLSLKYQKSAILLQDLHAEKNRRMTGQGNMRPIKYQGNPTMATKKFSPAQIAAQQLFAERARAGTLGKGTKRNPEPSHGFAKIGKPFSYDGRSWKVSGYAHTGKTFEAVTTDRKSPYRREEFSVAEMEGYYGLAGLESLSRKRNPDKSKPRAYVKRASQITGAPPSKRLQTRRKKALSAPAGYFPNPKSAAMMTAYQVICMHPKKHVVGIFKTMAEAKLVARAMADAKNVPYAVKTVKVHKTHFAI